MPLSHFLCPSCASINRFPKERAAQSPACGRCRAPLDVSGAPIHMNDDQLQKLIAQSPVPVLVDFYADWCGPCRTLSPILAQLSKETTGQLFVVKVDTERDQRVAASLGVQGIPAVFLFKGGKLADKAVGLRPLPFWQQWVYPYLAPAPAAASA